MASENKQSKYWKMLGGLAVLAVLTLLITPNLINRLQFYLYEVELKPNEFGDQFGFANALFSALAFAAFIVTLIMQKDELSAQHQEMKDTRKALEETRDQTALQVKSMSIQNFDNRFYNALKMMNQSQETTREKYEVYKIVNQCLLASDMIHGQLENSTYKQNSDLAKRICSGIAMRTGVHYSEEFRRQRVVLGECFAHIHGERATEATYLFDKSLNFIVAMMFNQFVDIEKIDGQTTVYSTSNQKVKLYKELFVSQLSHSEYLYLALYLELVAPEQLSRGARHLYLFDGYTPMKGVDNYIADPLFTEFPHCMPDEIFYEHMHYRPRNSSVALKRAVQDSSLSD